MVPAFMIRTTSPRLSAAWKAFHPANSSPASDADQGTYDQVLYLYNMRC
jgi:hypothetical protein